MHKTLIIILLSSVVLSMCQKEKADTGETNTPLLEVNGQVLYKEQLPTDLTSNMSKEDSATIVDGYIKRWVIDVVMYDYARRNIQNQEEIDKLVEEYKRLLTVQHYQQMLVDQRMQEPTQEDIANYYEKNISNFVLEEDIVRGVLVKIPLLAPKNTNLRKWMDACAPEDIDKLERYCVKNSGTLDYFEDKWLSANDVFAKLPVTDRDKHTLLTSEKHIELSDSVYMYLLKVTDYRTVGMTEPLDFASNKIRNALLNKGKFDFIHNFEEDLYKHVQNNIVYYEGKDSLNMEN